VATSIATARPSETFLARRFYFFMAVLAAAIVTYGFSRTIDEGLIHPSFVVPTILYFHVALFVGWLLLLLVQTGLVQTRHVKLHRKIGLSSIGFGAALALVGVWVSIVMARIEAQQGDPQAGPFLIVPFADMAFFGILFGLGVRYRKVIEAHRRLMLMAALSLTGAAFGRFPTFIVPHGGWYYLAVDMMVFLGVTRDLAVQRRVHLVYMIGLPLMMVGQLVTISIRYSHWWAVMSQALIK
jgi:uncharacterized membrane protein YozB (DUF420 family)